MRKLFIYCLISFFPLLATSQQISRYVFASAGGSTTSGQSEFSFTLGESMVVSFASNDGKYFQNQGFQQPSGLIVSSIRENKSPAPDLFVYPNPTRDLLYLKTSDNPGKLSGYEVYLYNMLGKLQETNLEIIPGSANLSVIDLTNQPKGAYILKIIDTENSDIQFSFTIIKIY